MRFRQWLESDVPTIDRAAPPPPGTRTLYHGTILAKYLKIVAEGRIRSWTGGDHVEKSSSGDLFETGLIWLFENKKLAWGYAHGREFAGRGQEFAAGGIVEVDVPTSLRLVDRYARLTAEQAAALVPHYPDWAQSYKPIKEGLALNYAVWRLWEYSKSKIGFGEVLKMLGLDGIIYETDQIAIAADDLPVAAAYPV